MTGHLLGGAGGLEAGISILAMQTRQIVSPHHEPRKRGPRLPSELRPQPPAAGRQRSTALLSNSFGFGGTNGSLVFRRWGAE